MRAAPTPLVGLREGEGCGRVARKLPTASPGPETAAVVMTGGSRGSAAHVRERDNRAMRDNCT